jgi:putative transposase
MLMSRGVVTRKDQRTMVAAGIRAIFNAPSRAHADEMLRQATTKHRKSAPKLAAWMKTNIPEGLTVLDEEIGPTDLARRLLRTTNGLERVNTEIKRRSSVATLFPSEDSVLRRSWQRTST